MITKEATYNQLESAIRIAFTDDKEIFKFYDKNVVVTNLDELVADVMRKIKDYPKNYPDTVFKIVQDKSKTVGYIVFKDGTLISFGLCMEYRKRKYLNEFFGLIRKELKGHFCCALWSRNIRAVKWLIGQGMKIADTNPQITILIK